MSQQQEKSLYRFLAIEQEFGSAEAIKQACLRIDELFDELGRARDMNFTVMLVSALWSAFFGGCVGFAIGWLFK